MAKHLCQLLHLIALLLLNICIVSAQKLPNKQQVSLRAPTNIKVDGKATEWDNKFQAYNTATDIFYTIANDDNNLYLAVQATEIIIINKIMEGGIKFSVTDPEKKNKVVSITYPLIDPKNKATFAIKKDWEDDSDRHEDSVMTAYNKTLSQKVKLIGTSGIEGVDSVLSIYNQDNIQAAGLFGRKRIYTCEMAISLKHLGLSTSSPLKKISYHILLSGPKTGVNVPMTIALPGATAADVAMVERVNAMVQRATSPTDFSGEYTLAK